jgi:hypothetical protein
VLHDREPQAPVARNWLVILSATLLMRSGTVFTGSITYKTNPASEINKLLDTKTSYLMHSALGMAIAG